jgi:hypothetical protein
MARAHRYGRLVIAASFMLAASSAIPACDSGGDDGPPCRADSLCAENDCRDCSVVASSSEATLESCQQCQGSACGVDLDPCSLYPCVEGVHVLQACGCDADCAGIAPFCGRYASIHGICQTSDSI